jgi:hypothetical protein
MGPLRGWALLAGEVEKVPDDPAASESLVLNDLTVLSARIGRVRFLHEVFGIGQNTGERIVDLVRDTGRELTHGDQPLGLDETFLERIEPPTHLIQGLSHLTQLILSA